MNGEPIRTSPGELEARVRSLERRLRRAQCRAAIGLVALIAIGWAQASRDAPPTVGADRVLRLRGLVIEDENGRPRVLLGAPVAKVEGRRRTDPATGLVVLNEAGQDRLQVGNCGGPMMGGAVQPRMSPSTGVMLCDLTGDERGGFGFDDNGRVVLGMDDREGEGVMLFIAPDLGMKGLIVNEQRARQTVQRLFLGLGKETALLKLQDGKGTERLQLRADPVEPPQLLVHDNEGQELADLLER
jgi:hypothetical protein